MDAEPTPSVWRGQLVRLRAFDAGDWAAYHAWNDDSEQARGLYWIPFPQPAVAAQRWAEREAGGSSESDDFRFVIDDHAGGFVGDVTVNNCDRRVGSFTYGVSIRRDCRRRGYASEAIAIVLGYYFDELRYQKATVSIADFNQPSIRLHEKLGFREEGRLRRVGFTHGKHHDMLMYGLTAEEWRAHRGSCSDE